MTMPVANQHLYRGFTGGFTVRHIAESLVSLDGDAAAADALRLMREGRYSVLGVREQGIVRGFVEPADLNGWYCRDHVRSFGAEDVVDDDLDFTRLIPLLGQRPRLFVRSLSQVDGIVTRTDLQRPPVRMWLFGMITIIEMSLHRMIEERYPDDSWTGLVSAERMAKATDLLAERRRRSQDLGLLDCLQFSDKGTLILKDDQLRGQVGFSSKRQGERVIRDLEALRNSLAHSQDIIRSDWETIVRLAEHIEQILSL